MNQTLNLVFREISENEAENVAQAADIIWREHYGAILAPAQIDYMLSRFQSAEAITAQLREGYRYFTASDKDSGVAAFCAVKLDAPDALFLSKLYVKRALRGQKVGKTLLSFAENAFGLTGEYTVKLTVNKHNLNSIAAYEHLGFIKTAEAVTDIGGGFVMDDFIMVKRVLP